MTGGPDEGAPVASIARPKERLTDRQRVALLAVVLSLACLAVASASIAMLYRVSLDETRSRLVGTVESQARLIEVVARFDAAQHADGPGAGTGSPREASIRQLAEAHEQLQGFGRTGEFTVARRQGDAIVFLFQRGRGGVTIPESIPFDAELAAPMRRALRGESGTVVGPDYQGHTVVAAYEPVAVLDLGMVAKIDLAEVRAPFVRAGLLCLLVTLCVVIVGVVLFFKVSTPIVERLDEYARQLELEIQERERAERQRIELEKMSSLGRLAAGMAHELNNPLMGIMNYARFCRGQVEPEGEAHGVLVDLERETERCASIVSDLLAFAHGGDPAGLAATEVDLRDLVERSLRLLAPRARDADVTLSSRVPDEAATLVANGDKLQQVLVNLVGNAIDAAADQPERRVEVAVIDRDEELVITVSDTGPGIPDDVAGQLFDPFFTTKPAGQGTGLGLSVARALVEEHGGHISWQSPAGEGTTMEVSLPGRSSSN